MIPASNASAQLPPGLRILAVEDEALLAIDLEDMLRAAGAADVIMARGIADVERAVAGLGSLDLAVINLDPSAAAGADLGPARAIKARGIPFLFASGADGAAAADFPEAVLVAKPYTRAAIVAGIIETLDRARVPGAPAAD